MMSADNVLDQAAHGIAREIRGLGPRFISCGIGEFFEHLVDRELQLRASLFERFVGVRTEVDVKTLQRRPLRMTAWKQSPGWTVSRLA